MKTNLPDFLYDDGCGAIRIGYNPDEVVTDEWEDWKQKADNSEKIKLIEQLMDEYESKAAQSGTINPNGSAENYFNGVVDGLNKAWKILNGVEDEL